MSPEEFRRMLISISVENIVQTHIISDDPGPYITRADLTVLESNLRVRFGLLANHPLATFVVGSAKLGFAIHPKRSRDGEDEKPAYRPYVPGDSDIDVAVVSPALYLFLWRDLARFGASQPKFPWHTELGFYMLHGWIRPDKFPHPAPPRCADWKEAIRQVGRSEAFRYKRLSCAIYHSQYFLELYQNRSVQAAREVEMAK